MSTAVICVILILCAVVGVKSYMKRLTSGCCGASSEKAVKRVKVADKNISHYPYHRILKVDGMVCGNCASHVENALNEMGGVWARVDLGHGEADVYMKTEVDEQELKDRVRNAGYTVYRIETRE